MRGITGLRTVALALMLLTVGGCRHFAEMNTQDPYAVMGPKGVGQNIRHIRDDVPPRIKPVVLPEGPMTVHEVIETALRYGPQSRQSLEGISQALAALGQTKGLYLPQASGDVGLQKSKTMAFGETSHADDIYSKRWNMTLSAQWTLVDFVRRHAMASSEASVRSAYAQHELQLLDIALTAEVSYYRLLEAQALLDVVKETVRLRERYVEFAERRSGTVAGKAELFQAEADLAEARTTLVEAQAQLRQFRGQLASVMGYRPNADVQIVGFDGDVPEYELSEIEDMLATAARERPRLKALAAEVARLGEELAIQEGSRLPTLSASGSYGVTAPHFVPDAGHNEWLLGLNVSVEVFTGFQRTYAILQVKHQLRAARAAYEAALRRVELEVWQAHSEVVRARDAIETSQAFIDSAAANLEQTTRQFQNGQIDIVRLNEAQTSYTRSQFALIRSRLDYRSAVAQLNRSLGRGLDRVPADLKD